MRFEPPADAVREVVGRALAEDVGVLGDLTAALIPAGVRSGGVLMPRAGGILAGRAAATEVFAHVDPVLVVEWSAGDGDDIEPGRPVARLRGPLASMLTAERTALNLLSHLSGVATLTRRYVFAVGGRAVIRDTRKTTPGLRALEKAAVRAGGGANHRGSLSDGILIKDNHLAATSISSVVERARQLWPGRTVEVECDTEAQVKEAVAAGADLVLLDNMSPAEVSACVAHRAASGCLFEVSGGVRLETVRAYADAGADLVSVGALTHSAPALDIGLDIDLDIDPEQG